MRFLLLFSLLLTCSSAFAQENPFFSVKERLRILLWVEGVEEPREQKKEVSQYPELPEEITHVLRKF